MARGVEVERGRGVNGGRGSRLGYQSGSLLKCCANFICKLWQKRGLYANLHCALWQGVMQRGEGGGFCDSWFWFCSPVLWHSLLSSHGHLTLFLMMCAVCASYRDNTHGKYLENAAQSPLSLHSSPLSLPLPLPAAVHHHCTVCFGTFIWRKSVKF